MHTFESDALRRMHDAMRSEPAKAAVEHADKIAAGAVGGVDPSESQKEARQWVALGLSFDKASADADIAKWIAKLEAKEAKKKAAEELAALRRAERGGDATP